MAYRVLADARIRVWVAGAGADDKLSWVFADQVFEGDFVVADDGDGGAFEDEVLVDVPCEGVIVVDEDEVGGGGERCSGGGLVRRMVD